MVEKTADGLSIDVDLSLDTSSMVADLRDTADSLNSLADELEEENDGDTTDNDKVDTNGVTTELVPLQTDPPYEFVEDIADYAIKVDTYNVENGYVDYFSIDDIEFVWPIRQGWAVSDVTLGKTTLGQIVYCRVWYRPIANNRYDVADE